MPFGSEATLVSAEALTVIEDCIKYDHKCDALIAAMVIQRDDRALEATSHGLMLGHMGPVAHALYAIEALLRMNDRAKRVIIYEHHKIRQNNESIATIQRMIEESYANAAIYNQLRQQVNTSSHELGTMRNSYHIQQQGPSYINATYHRVVSGPAVNTRRNHPSRSGQPTTPTTRRSSLSLDAITATPSASCSARTTTPAGSFVSVSPASSISAAFGAGISGSQMPHFGVKHLFGVSGNEKIDEDDEDAIFEALDR